MRLVKGVALAQSAVAIALVVLAIATTDWRPLAMATLMAYGATLLWKDALAAETWQVALLIIGTPLAIAGLLAIRLWADSEFLLAVNSFALVAVIATATWCAFRLGRPTPAQSVES